MGGMAGSESMVISSGVGEFGVSVSEVFEGVMPHEDWARTLRLMVVMPPRSRGRRRSLLRVTFFMGTGGWVFLT